MELTQIHSWCGLDIVSMSCQLVLRGERLISLTLNVRRVVVIMSSRYFMLLMMWQMIDILVSLNIVSWSFRSITSLYSLILLIVILIIFPSKMTSIISLFFLPLINFFLTLYFYQPIQTMNQGSCPLIGHLYFWLICFILLYYNFFT